MAPPQESKKASGIKAHENNKSVVMPRSEGDTSTKATSGEPYYPTVVSTRFRTPSLHT